MAMVVCRFRKLKTTSDLRNVGSHNSREKYIKHYEIEGQIIKSYGNEKPEWVRDRDKVRLNDGELQFEGETINSGWHKAVEAANLKRQPQSNSSVAIEAIFSASNGDFMTDDQWKKYLTECKNWAEKKLGKENVLQWNFHFDETTPHLHMIFIPIVRGKEKNRYSSGHFLGGPEGLREIQKEFSEEVGQKYNFKRGVEGSKKKHTDQNEWKSELIKKETALNSVEIELDKKEVEILKKIELVGRYKSEKLEELEVQKKELDIKEKDIMQREQRIQELEKLEENTIRGIILNATKGKTPEFVKRVVDYIKKQLPDFVKTCTENVMSNKDRTSVIIKNPTKGIKI